MPRGVSLAVAIPPIRWAGGRTGLPVLGMASVLRAPSEQEKLQSLRSNAVWGMQKLTHTWVSAAPCPGLTR